MISHQKILAKEEVQFAGGKDSIFAAVIYRVDHYEKIGGERIVFLGCVLFHLGRGAHRNTVFD